MYLSYPSFAHTLLSMFTSITGMTHVCLNQGLNAVMGELRDTPEFSTMTGELVRDFCYAKKNIIIPL